MYHLCNTKILPKIEKKIHFVHRKSFSVVSQDQIFFGLVTWGRRGGGQELLFFQVKKNLEIFKFFKASGVIAGFLLPSMSNDPHLSEVKPDFWPGGKHRIEKFHA